MTTSNDQVRIVVVGSANMDLVARAPRLPKPGETLIGKGFEMIPGGKGANQAVACARLGAQTYFVGRIGTDSYGDELLRSLTEAGVNPQHLARDSSVGSGIAAISVDDSTGENCIIVVPGANGRLTAADVEASEETIAQSNAVVCSLEVPLAVIEAAVGIASRKGILSIVNPAPAMALPRELIQQIAILTPNEHEVAILAGDPTLPPIDAARRLLDMGAWCVVVTLGPEGAMAVSRNDPSQILETRGVMVHKVVDTTAAGDCFTGALAVALSEGRSLENAMGFACAAASLSVTKAGAQRSLPTRVEVDCFQEPSGRSLMHQAAQV